MGISTMKNFFNCILQFSSKRFYSFPLFLNKMLKTLKVPFETTIYFHPSLNSRFMNK